MDELRLPLSESHADIIRSSKGNGTAFIGEQNLFALTPLNISFKDDSKLKPMVSDESHNLNSHKFRNTWETECENDEEFEVPDTPGDIWEETDKPFLLVDITRYRTVASETDTDATVAEGLHAELISLRDQLDDVLEAMFEAKIFFHVENSFETRESAIAQGQRLYPGHRFITLEYPEVMYISNLFVPSAEFWDSIDTKNYTSEVPSLNILNAWIIKCSRSPNWKIKMLNEVKHLSLKEEILKLESEEIVDRAEGLSSLIDELEVLRQESAKTDDLDLLESIEKEMEELHLHLSECVKGEDLEEDGMSVVDMIIAMVLQRCTILNPNSSFWRETHEAIVNAWCKDFGRLPRSRP